MSHPDFPDAAARRAQVWSDYWAGGALHSCASSFQGNYDGAIAAFWRARFANLPVDARVLDLCCGNAPLSKLLLEQGDGAQVTLDALDAARIAPPWLNSLEPQRRARLRVHGEADARALPFDAASFDLCMSQYGVEYAGLAAMDEVARVLKRGAVFAAVLHHADGLPVRIARAELDHLAWLRRPGGLLDRVAAMIEPMARASTPAGQASLSTDAGAIASRTAFNAALGEIEQRLQGAAFGDLLFEARDAAMELLGTARARGEVAAREAFSTWQATLQAHELRQRELVDCGLDLAQVRALMAPLGDAEAAIAEIEFRPGALAGWTVEARRR